MNRIKAYGLLIAGFIALAFITLSIQGCKSNPGGSGYCEVRATAGKIDCDDAHCPSPKKCVLQTRKKGTSNDWKDIGQPVENDPAMEYRCLCRN